MRRFVVALAAAIVLLAPAASLAAPVTLYYRGTWGFFDPPSDAPAFHAALATYGVSTGSALLFSVTVDSAIGDSDPSATSGLYQSAIVGARLEVGSLFLGCSGASSCGSAVPNFSGPVGGAQIHPNSVHMVGSLTTMPKIGGGLFAPSFLDFHAQSLASFLGSDSLASALSNASGWPAPTLSIGFQGSGVGAGLNLALSNLTLVSVPEVSALSTLASGLTVYLLFRRRTRVSKISR